MPAKRKRNYKREYARNQASKKARLDRAGRVKARREAEKRGLVRKGDGKDVHHKDGNPRNNRPSNLQVTSRRVNRATKKKGGKRRS